MAKEQAQQHTRQSCRVEWEINFSLLAFVSASFFSYIQFFGWFFFFFSFFPFLISRALTRNARNVVCCYVVILMRKMAAEERRKTEKNGKCFQDIIKIKIKMPLQPPANCHKFMKISTFSIFNREAFLECLKTVSSSAGAGSTVRNLWLFLHSPNSHPLAHPENVSSIFQFTFYRGETEV